MNDPDQHCWGSVDGWTGPFLLLDSATDDQTCPEGSELVGPYGSGTISADFACTCTCGSVDACGTVAIHAVQGMCSVGANLGSVSEGECTAFGTTSLYVSFPAPAETCGQPTDGSTFDEPQWNEQVRGCQVSGSSCNDGAGLCLPEIDSGMQYCILREGPYDCPDPYVEQTTAYADIADTRSCSTCGCAPTKGELPYCQATLYDEDNCTGAANVIDAHESDSCESFPGNDPGAIEVSTVDTCAETGGAPSGGVQPANPITICCAP